MEIAILILNVVFLGAVSWWFWKQDNSDIRKFYWPACSLKLIAGVALGIIYSTYYSISDTRFFFNAACEAGKLVTTDFSAYVDFLFSPPEGYFQGETRTMFFIKIVSIVAFFTNGNYWIASLYFSLISFFSAWWLARTISCYFPEYKHAGVIALLFFPSVVFWSAGIIKESLAMVGLFCMATVFLHVWMENKLSLAHLAVLILSVILAWNLKYYYVGLFVPVFLATWLTRRAASGRTFSWQVMAWMGLLLGMLLAAGWIHPNFASDRIFQVIVSTNEALLAASDPEDVIRYNSLQPTWFSMVVNSPWALVSGLFRPFLWETDSAFKFLASVENLVLLVLVASAIRSGKAVLHSPQRLLVLSVIAYCVLVCIFLALSTPNMGTLFRYRVGFLPFLLILVCHQPFLSKFLSKLT